jgi:hypothetical protein
MLNLAWLIGQQGANYSLELMREPQCRHSREGGNPLWRLWIPAFAGMTVLIDNLDLL